MTVETKTMEFEKVLKMFENVVSKGVSRPVLQYVYFDGEWLIGTNSHVLLRVNSSYITDNPLNPGEFIDPKTKEKEEAHKFKYYKTERLIPDNSNTTVLLDKNTKEFQDHVKAAKNGKPKRIVSLKFNDNSTTITAKEDEDNPAYNATTENVKPEGDSLLIAVNGKYLNDTLDTVKKFNRLTKQPTEMKMLGNKMPIHFNQEGVFDLIVMPIRLY